jgi:hypothetical protein
MVKRHPLPGIESDGKALTLHLGEFTSFLLDLCRREVDTGAVQLSLLIEVVVDGVGFALAVLIAHVGLGRVRYLVLDYEGLGKILWDLHRLLALRVFGQLVQLHLPVEEVLVSLLSLRRGRVEAEVLLPRITSALEYFQLGRAQVDIPSVRALVFASYRREATHRSILLWREDYSLHLGLNHVLVELEWTRLLLASLPRPKRTLRLRLAH